MQFAAAFHHHQSVDAMDLDGEVLLFALLQKKVSKEKSHHQNWVHPVCCRLETGQYQLAGSCSVPFINNTVSNFSRGESSDILKNSEMHDNTETSRSE